MHPDLSRRLTFTQLDEALLAEGLFGARMTLEDRVYPRFFVRFRTVGETDRLLRFDANNYDFEAIDVEPVDLDTRDPLDPGAWMTRSNGPFPAHPRPGGRPFLCIKGTRAFYTHEFHSPKVTGQRWEHHRRDLKLVELLTFIKNNFESGAWK